MVKVRSMAALLELTGCAENTREPAEVQATGPLKDGTFARKASLLPWVELCKGLLTGKSFECVNPVR